MAWLLLESRIGSIPRELSKIDVANPGQAAAISSVINDDSNEVGAVHIGVVHRFDLDSDQVSPNEADISELSFLTPDELRARYDRLETWSQICLDSLEAILAS